MSILYLDTETFSSVPIAYGMYAYMASVELLLLSYARDDDPVQVWDVTASRMPRDLEHFLSRKDFVFCAHNASFDRHVLKTCLHVNHTLWLDTSAIARRCSLPAGLDELCTLFKLSEDKAKKKTGRRLILLFCRPQGVGRKVQRATSVTHPELWNDFLVYAAGDVDAMRCLHQKMPTWNNSAKEDAVFYLDHAINDRGFKIDTFLAAKAIEALRLEKEDSDLSTQKATQQVVTTTNQRDKLLSYILNEYGVTLPNLQDSTILRRLNDPDLPEAVKYLLSLRMTSAKTSTCKYDTVMRGLSHDKRLRDTLLYYGASRTGRWSGRMFQPQNLPRPVYSQDMLDVGIIAIKKDCISLFFDNTSSICTSVIRSLIVPKKAHKLVVSDYASIEGRVLAWLSGETWKLRAYSEYDTGTGYDMYVLTYATLFGVPAETVTKEQRQLGKVLELALGYAGGVGAFVTFATSFNLELEKLTAVALPVDLTESAEQLYEYLLAQDSVPNVSREVFVVCDSLKRMWRENSPATETLWKAIDNAVRDTCSRSIAHTIGRVIIDKKGTWLRIRLPSDRYLCYPGIRVDENEITYSGKDQYSRKWTRLKTYGGKLVENITQAVARDVLVNGMIEADREGYPIILTVHDELITEVPDVPEYSHEALSTVMTRKAEWMEGLPLSAAGYEAYRYRK